MKRIIREFTHEPIITLMPDVTFAQVPFWFNGTLRPLKMDIFLPKHRDQAAPQPAIVWICGGAFQQIDRHIWMGELLWYAKHGFTVASVEYRISTQAVFPAQIVDVKCAIRYLRAHAAELCVDPERIAVMGESAGGYLACMMGVTGRTRAFDMGEYLDQSSAVQAVVDFYGVTELGGARAGSVTEDGVLLMQGDATVMMMGERPTENPEAYKKATPANWIDANCPPFLILHGDKDPLVNVGQSERFYDALQRAGVPVELDIYAGVAHGADEFYQEDTKRRILDFLRAHL